MGFSDQYPTIIDGLVKKRGSFGGVDSLGRPLPAMVAQDHVALLALLYTPLANAIRKASDVVAPAGFADDGGVIGDSIFDGDDASQAQLISVTAERYLSGVASASSAHQRKPNALSNYYEPARLARLIQGNEQNLIAFAWQAVDDYQSCIVTAAGAAFTYGSAPVAQDVNKAFLRSWRALCADIDVLGENPPPSFASDLLGALAAAANASAKSAGEVAAAAGNTAGDLAGNFLGGFLDNAGLVALAIAGVVIYKVV